MLSIFKIGKERYGHDWRSKFDQGKLNPHGGSIALGHPLGATGTRLLLTLALELRRRGGRYGLATLCIGVGQGQAALFERT